MAKKQHVLRQVTKPAHARTLVFGRNKTGKSTFCYTAVEEGKTLVADFGFSTNTAMNIERFKPIIDEGLAYEMREVADVNGLYHALSAEGENWIEEYGLKFLILDEIDNWYEQFMEHRMEQVIAEKPERNPYKPALDDYGVVRMMMKYAIKSIFTLPIHIFITSWVQEDLDEVTGRKELLPSLPGKLGNEVSGECDVVAMNIGIDKKGGEATATYEMLCQPTTRYTNVGIRGGGFPATIVNPDMKTFMGYWSNR